jgi:phosphate:Na+ symporter
MQILLQILSGVALVVWGTDLVKIAAIRLLKVRLTRLLANVAPSSIKSASAGAFVAVLLQSSNAASVFICSFIGKGVLTVSAGLFALLGANVGTALAARFLTFDVGHALPLILILGISLHLKGKGRALGHAGRVIVGLGIIIFGLKTISGIASSIFDSPQFSYLITSIPNDRWLFTLFGAVLTIVCYSSLAIVALAAELVGHGGLSVDLGISIILGANIGTAVSAAMAASSFGETSKLASAVNLSFRCVSAISATVLMENFGLPAGMPKAMRPDLLIYVHICFNLVVLVLACPFVRRIAAGIERAHRSGAGDEGAPKYLYTEVGRPDHAIAAATREVLRISNRLESMLSNSRTVVANADGRLAGETANIDSDIDQIYTAVRRYLNEVPLGQLSARDRSRWRSVLLMAINLEHAGDILENSLKKLESRIKHRDLLFSEMQCHALLDLYGQLSNLLRLRTYALLHNDDSAEEVVNLWGDVDRSVVSSVDEYLEAMVCADTFDLSADVVYLDLISDLQYVGSLFTGRRPVGEDPLSLQMQA